MLTRDGEPVAGLITLTLSVSEESVDRLFLLSGSRDCIYTFDVGKAIEDELIAKVFDVYLRNYTAEELRGNRDLLRGMYESTQRELDSTISGYGLRLDNFYVKWGVPRTPKRPAGTVVVYTDKVTNISRIHWTSCRYAKDPETANRCIHNTENWWHGPYENVQQAMSSDKNAGIDVSACKVCRPTSK